MKTKLHLLFIVLALLALATLNSQLATARAQGTAFTYQGRLNDGTNPANGSYDLRFYLRDAVTAGNPVGTTNTVAPLAASNGLFTVTLDFGSKVFTGADRWLEIGVRTNGSAGAYTTLSPRQPLTPSPYAILAGSLNGVLPDAQLSANIARLNANQNFIGNITFNPPAGAPFLVGNTNRVANFNADLLDGFDSGAFWKVLGNTGTLGGSNFLGTADNQALEFKVNNTRGLRLEPTLYTDTVNVIGGSARNFVGAGVVGATIGGGGAGSYAGVAYTNRVEANFDTVSGGNQNTIQPNADSATIGGGYLNTIQTSASYATIGGGGENAIQTNANYATIGGGYLNTVQTNAQYATISGGARNIIQPSAIVGTVGGGALNTIQPNANYATIGGGFLNTIQPNAYYATIPGGELNAATNFAFAAGHRAKANHTGAFVWADSTDAADFASTTNNQFLIRAQNGVGINLNNPSAALDVNGKVKMTQFQLGLSATAGQILTADAAGVGSWQPPTFTGDVTIANPSDLNFGATTRQMINLWNANYGLGVQNNTLYSRSDGGFAWFQHGVHNNNQNDPGTGGTNLMWLDSGGNLFANASITVDVVNANNGSYYPGLVFGSGSGETISSQRGTNGSNRYGLDFYTGFNPRLSIARDGSVGIGTQSPTDALLDVEGDIHINDHNVFLRGGSDRNHGLGWYGNGKPFTGENIDGPVLYGWSGGALGTTDGGQKVALRWNQSGNVTVKVLEITGGSDLAEPFPMSDDAIPKGALVVIDDEHPGGLKLSGEPYDTRVAGIVSGANGVNPGLTLRQEGKLDDGQNVALSGRVYALADASNAPIKPGDLLTSSRTPGRVMKVTDPTRAQGAVVGKAMSALREGQGLVLVLVTLQ